MDTGDLLKVLAKAKIWNTLAPSLNLWAIYVLIVIVLTAKFGVLVTALFSAFGVIFWYMQEEKVKKACTKWWKCLPLFKFHTVFLVIELGTFAAVGYFLKPVLLAGAVVERHNE